MLMRDAMNSFAKKALDKCKVAQLPPYDEDTLHIHIPKHDVPIFETLKQDDCLVLEFMDYILNPPEGFTLHDNWNRGVKPKFKTVKACISQVMGKMVKLSCIGYDIDNDLDICEMWEGWIPSDGMKIIKRL